MCFSGFDNVLSSKRRALGVLKVLKYWLDDAFVVCNVLAKTLIFIRVTGIKKA